MARAARGPNRNKNKRRAPTGPSWGRAQVGGSGQQGLDGDTGWGRVETGLKLPPVLFFVGSKNGPKSINIDKVLICEVRGSASNVATG